ncbi:MAG TPA: hypothetical protein ENJ49_00200, partial [Candidatus Moranbacteria bacterium]|nr:hypothetical protein [Candidatus Moranbacteria bacterium]
MRANRSGVRDFLESYLAEISSPKTAEEMNVVLNDIPNRKLAEERILGELDSIPLQELIRFYFLRKEEGKHYDDICVAVEGRIIIALSESDDVCYFSVKIVQQLANIGLASLLARKSSKLRLEWEDIYWFPFQDRIMADFFQNSFRKWLNQASFERLKGLVKSIKLPEKYLVILLERAETLLSELSTEDLERKARRYENRPWCRPAVFLPIIREILEERYIDEALETNNLHSLLLSKAEVLGNDEVWTHFLNILQRSSLKDIEGVFGHKFLDGRWLEPVSREILPSGYLPVLTNYYEVCLDETLPLRENDFAWLWHCLAGCPFPAFYNRISECVLSALPTVSPERAWEIAEERREEEQLSFCRRIVWQGYIAWFFPKIATETDADKLLSWLLVCKKNKHRRRIKSRLKKVWWGWSFRELGEFELDLDGYQIQINNLHWVVKLRKTILCEKLPEYLQSVRSLDDLAWAYGLCGIQEHQRRLWIVATGETLQRMPVRIL